MRPDNGQFADPYHWYKISLPNSYNDFVRMGNKIDNKMISKLGDLKWDSNLPECDHSDSKKKYILIYSYDIGSNFDYSMNALSWVGYTMVAHGKLLGVHVFF